MAKKMSISDKQLKVELFKLFEGGNTAKWSKSGTFGKIRELYSVAKDRFDKTFDFALSEWAKTKEKAQSEQSIDNVKTELKSGLKSKIERQLILQKQIDQCLSELDSGKVNGYDMLGNAYERELTIMERSQLRKTLKELQSEISKMEGDYAPIKQEIKTEEVGEPKPVAVINFDGKKIELM